MAGGIHVDGALQVRSSDGNWAAVAIGSQFTKADLDGGKLSIRGEAASQQARNRIYDQIKAVVAYTRTGLG